MDRKTGAAEGQSADAAREIERLTAAGKCKQAVELAKSEHKRLNTPESEKRLIDAYLARIEQFQNKGATQDAQTLLNLVRQRFPAYQGRLENLALKSAAAEGNIEALVAPLGRPDLPPERRALIESALRRSLSDLSRLANCTTLPPDHALRAAAAALSSAFKAVTSGPVSSEQIALTEIPRQSPLADWKLLVRGMTAFYGNQDDLCRRNLAAIGEGSAVRRLANVLVAAMDQAPLLPGRSGALQARIAGGDQSLRKALEGLEAAFKSYHLPSLERAIRAALDACSATHPELLEKLRQRISVRCAIEDVPVKNVLKVMGPARKDSAFWRLMARSAEMQQAPVPAAAMWDRFRIHAISEGMFAPQSPEEATVRLHAAGVLAQAYARPSTDPRLFRHLLDYYRNQPDEIAALRPRSEAEVDQATDANRLFRAVVEIDPHAPAFLQWYAWAQGSRLPDRQLQELAELWHRKLPAEPKPLLVLSQLAEGRKALKLSLKYLSEAEALDPINPAVRKARMRLTLSTAWRHLKDRKPHLVEQDLAALAALPAMSEGDRPALLEAMRAASSAIAGDVTGAQQAAERIAGRAGPLVAPYLLESVKQFIKLPFQAPPQLTPPLLMEPVAVAEAESRIIRLIKETDLKIYRPKSWEPVIAEALAQTPCPLSQTVLLNIAQGATDTGRFEQAYRASTAGLASATGANAAWFLLRRAQSLPEWAGRRATQCLRAALELSRQANDPELAARIAESIDLIPEAQDAVNSSSGRGIGAELLEDVLKSERSARHYPRNMAEAERYVVAMAVPSRFDEYEDDDEYDDDEDEYESGPFDDPDLSELSAGITPEMIREMARSIGMPVPRKGEALDPKMVNQIASMLAEILGPQGGLDEPPRGRGFLPSFFGRGRRKKS